MNPKVDFKAQNSRENASVNEAIAYRTVLNESGLNLSPVIYAVPTTVEGGNFAASVNNGVETKESNFVPIDNLHILPDDQLHLFFESDNRTFHNVGLVRDRFVVNQYPVGLIVEQLKAEINQK